MKSAGSREIAFGSDTCRQPRGTRERVMRRIYGGQTMNRIELSGKSQGKGRNGYFQILSVELMNIPTDLDGEVLHIDFYPRRRANCVGPARLLLSIEDATKLAQVFGEAVESRPLVANIEHGELVCECGHRGTPRLEESGYQVSHALVEIVGDTIIARGWDGSSRAVSEDGDAYWLMFDGCGRLHPLLPELHIDWR